MVEEITATLQKTFLIAILKNSEPNSTKALSEHEQA